MKPPAETTTTTAEVVKPEAESKPAEAPTGAPETYEAFKAPEGLEITADSIAHVTPLFKELGLSQEQAQKLVDFDSARVKSITDAGLKAYNDLRDNWRAEVTKDTTLAANGDLKPEVKASIAQAIDSLGADKATAFREALNLTGVGDNPAFIRGFLELAKRVGEGKSVNPGNPTAQSQAKPGSGQPSAAASLYPNLPSSSAS